ncbi:MAG: DUF502 domain-containing protein [Bacilli bacterium]
MMKTLRNYFVSGVITIVPIGIVIWVVVQLFNFFDNLLGAELTTVDHHYIPGLGLLFTVILITLAGALASHWASRRLFAYIDGLLKKVPVIKSIYGIVKDTVESFVGNRHGFQKVVLITLPDSGIELVGFLTRSGDMEIFGAEGDDKLAVFVPLSFQMSGFTMIVPKERVKILDMPVEEGIKYTFSAGLSRDNKVQQPTDAHIFSNLFGGRRSPPVD